MPDTRLTISGNSIVFEFCCITSELNDTGKNFVPVIFKGTNLRNICIDGRRGSSRKEEINARYQIRNYQKDRRALQIR